MRRKRASTRKMAWTSKHPGVAVDILFKHNPQSTKQSEMLKRQTANNSMLTETTILYGLGCMTEKKMKFTRNAILSGLGKTHAPRR